MADQAVADQKDVHEDILLAPIAHTGPGFYWTVAGLSVFILWGAVAYAVQFYLLLPYQPCLFVDNRSVAPVE